MGLLMALGLPESCWNEIDKPAPKELVTAMVKGPATAGAAPTAGLGAGVTVGSRAPPMAVPRPSLEMTPSAARAGDARARRKGTRVLVRCMVVMLEGDGIKVSW